MESATTATPPAFGIIKARTRFFGLTLDECIQTFFGGNAIVAVIVLGLITIFLFREGYDFFSQDRTNLRIYREAGLEYVDYMRSEDRDHTALTRYLADIRLKALQAYQKEQHLGAAEANQKLAAFDEFVDHFGSAIDPVRSIASDLSDTAVAIKTKFSVNEDKKTQKSQLVDANRGADADKVSVENIDFKAELQPLLAALPGFLAANHTYAEQVRTLLTQLPAMPNAELTKRIQRFGALATQFLAGLPETEQRLKEWDYAKPIPVYAPLVNFITGREWLTASFWQDWYGILPLFIGSLMVSIVALVIAVPLGVGAAIYVNQIARPVEQRLIKPAIEFISAFPSVVLGFFGIAVLGEKLRWLSHQDWLSWFPGFPIAERLNILTAGCLLALIAIPTIFTLAEDAINNVPRSFKEASFALGANRLQTIIKIIVPASLSGIVSAVLLGLGRVIGETMVVLLCAGNRIAIPDFSAGLAVITQPVHTMTGIIAQEMGEVVQGSLHYRALFVVGIVLFFLSLAINYIAQNIVRKYRISIG